MNEITITFTSKSTYKINLLMALYELIEDVSPEKSSAILDYTDSILCEIGTRIVEIESELINAGIERRTPYYDAVLLAERRGRAVKSNG